MPFGKISVRVYGLLMNSEKQILVTDEIYEGQRLTKFPGGGMEKGEGAIDCLKRECIEELGQEVNVKEHFYTSDNYIPSTFYPDFQIICIYYFIETKEKYCFEIKQKRFDFANETSNTVVFRWVPLDKIKDEPFTYDNDKKVARMLYNSYK